MTTTDQINQILKVCYNDYEIAGGHVFKRMHDSLRESINDEMFLDFLLKYHNSRLPPLSIQYHVKKNPVFVKPIYKMVVIDGLFTISDRQIRLKSCADSCSDTGISFSLN